MADSLGVVGGVAVTVCEPGPAPQGSWGKGLSRARFAQGDAPRATRRDADAGYTERRMREMENMGSGDARRAYRG